MRKRKIPRAARFLLLILLACLLIYAGLIAYVCIQEGKVLDHLGERQDYQAIIVLGAQVKPDGSPSIQLSWRLDAAAEAYRKHPVPIVVCGGKGKDEPYPEADAMEAYLAAGGTDRADVLKDPDSFNTRENLINAKKLLEAGNKNIQRVLIVTSDYHVPRAMALAEDLGFDAIGLGSPCKPEFWLKNHAREALAWVKYWLQKYLGIRL